MEITKKIMEKQSYRFIGNHSAIKICEWTKKSLIDKGECYKSRFYGIKSHRCCQMSPWILCNNKCVHCWRPIELEICLDSNKINEPCEIINQALEKQRKLLIGFKGNPKINIKKYKEAQEPMQFAISLIGEPTLYPKIGKFISELRKKGKTTFVVTNGLQPEILKKLGENKQLPTQLYLSLNSHSKELYEKWHKSNKKDAWKKFNETLKLFPVLKTRKVIRMTLVKGLNDKNEHIKEYSKLILKAHPNFLEIKSYMAIGFSRERLGYDKMLSHNEIREYSKKLVKELKNNYKVLDEHKLSRVALIGKDKKNMKIKKSEI
ncbi:4-demethylwyosine synthase TYW1 [Candidatus Pacearchaeota archaeon]|nr:4-demethylwyosine synthase TYW1 [Candidatus Pacearchaeota archaeon]